MRAIAMIERAWVSPDKILAAFAEEPFAVALVSGGEGAAWSYVARAPSRVLSLAPGHAGDPVTRMRSLLGQATGAAVDGPPFQGGLIGLACYELGARFEPLALHRAPGWPDLVCGLYPAVLAFDHQRGRVLAIGRGGDDAEAAARAEAAAGWLTLVARQSPDGPLTDSLTGDPSGSYQDAVAEIVGRIGAGEIFQANVARRWRGRLAAGALPFDLLQRLLTQSPAPFAAYLRLPGKAVVSNSPERFIGVRAGRDGALRGRTQPIKGTRPRGATPDEDRRLAAELIASPKDRAENLMIVDLMRNDLARTSEAVQATALFECRSFVNVHHLVSTVEARVRPGLGGLDVFAGAFPPGSITGAPKVQAMKIIAALEPPRGPYCGSMFWAGLDGALDSSVLIRTAVFEKDAEGWSVEARAGAGIVADSVPGEEARETEAKIAAIAKALTGALTKGAA